ncbi:MAG: cytidylyltransferase domain-containing protein [Kiloniellales bacterium]
MTETVSASPRALGVIPARGGSKRLPRKNVLPVAGHPLIAHTIMAAQKARLLTDWLVTSEDDEIIAVARQYGAPVPFKRPAELAGDEVRNIDTVRHALAFMEGSTGAPYDMVVLLQPTCPIRDPAHIDEAVRRLWTSGMDTLASVKGPHRKRDPILKALRDGVLEPYCRGEADGAEVEPFYLYNASIYAAKRDYFLREGRLISRRQVPLVMDRFHSADVDEMADVVLVEAYFAHLAQQTSPKGGSA